MKRLKKISRKDYQEALKPLVNDFAEAGIRLRVERGDFNSDFCLVNGELTVFINRNLDLSSQLRVIKELKDKPGIVEKFSQIESQEKGNVKRPTSVHPV